MLKLLVTFAFIWLPKNFTKEVSPAECFELLGKEKVIGESLLASLQEIARFRNILDFRYWEIDDKRVY